MKDIIKFPNYARESFQGNSQRFLATDNVKRHSTTIFLGYQIVNRSSLALYLYNPGGVYLITSV